MTTNKPPEGKRVEDAVLVGPFTSRERAAGSELQRKGAS